MAAKKPKGKRRGAGPRKLPSSQEGLAYLLRAVDRCVEAAARHQHRQHLRYQELKKALDDPQRLVECRPLFDKMAEVALDQLASGPPPFDVVVPYVDEETVKPLLDQYKDAADRLRSRPHPASPSLEAWRPWIVALAGLLEAQDKITALLRDLRERLLGALDQAPTGKTGKSNGPSGKKNGKKRKTGPQQAMPRNQDVRTLIRLIENEKDPSRTLTDIAIEFANGDKKRAQSLLRSVRSYSHLFRKRKR